MESTVHYELGPDDQEYQVEAVFGKFIQGRYSGPPDQCYPDEGGDIEEILAYKVVAVINGAKKLEKVDPSVVYELLAAQEGISKDAAQDKVEGDLIANVEYTDDYGPEDPPDYEDSWWNP